MASNEYHPLISICIPTYNRVDALEKCLEAIICNKAYSKEEIEIVVSDNASTDGTEELMTSFVKQHEHVVYHRNDVNIGGEANFLKVLSLGSGQFLKLLNDYCVFCTDGLTFLVDLVRQCVGKNQMLLFVNDKKYHQRQMFECDSLDKVVSLSYWNMSWIGSYGYWKDVFMSLSDHLAAKDTQFLQIDWFLRQFAKTKKCCVGRYHFLDVISFNSMVGGYDFMKVHTTNFLGMFERASKEELLSEKALVDLKKHLFFALLKRYYQLHVKQRKGYAFDMSNGLDLFYKHFHQYWWYKKGMAWLMVKTVTFRFKRIFRKKI